MTLGDIDIADRIDAGEIVVDPEPTPEQIQPASFDLRMGGTLVPMNPGPWPDVIEDDMGTLKVPGWRRNPRPAPAFFLGATLDDLTLPRDIVGRMAGRSTFAREGLVVHLTAGVVDPGWSGRLTLEIVNFSWHDVEVDVGERVAQIVFDQLRRPSGGYGGAYAGADGPERSHRTTD